MSATYSAYCRFCAKLKPYDKLVNFQSDGERRLKVIEKLSRLSLEVFNFNSPHDDLPKTVCFPCMQSLDSAFEFVLNVESSQHEFSTLGETIVKQEVFNNGSSPQETPVTEPVVKLEFEIGNEVSHSSEVAVTCNSEVIEVNTEKDAKNKIEASKKNCLLKIIPVEFQVSWKDYSWLCAYCDIMFSSIDELKEHSMKSHGCCNPYRCPDCRIRKMNLDGYILHVKRHRNNLKLSCYKCHRTFFREYDAIMHRKEHITKFRCPGCNENFKNNEEYLEHFNMYNKDKKIREVPAEQLTDDLKCVFCHKQFRYKGGLTTHLLTQHREIKKNHTCDKCGKCFTTKANLIAHILMHDDIRPYQCEKCKHSFRLRSQLSRHMGTHDGKRPFNCDKCGRCFRLKKQLNTHSIVHTDAMPHICSYCNKGFKHKSTFVQHVRLHTGERPYKCHMCSGGFTNWSNYNKHMMRHHGLNMARSQHPTHGLLTMDNTDKFGNKLAVDLTVRKKNNSIPKRGRPKMNKNSKKLIPSTEIKTEVT